MEGVFIDDSIIATEGENNDLIEELCDLKWDTQAGTSDVMFLTEGDVIFSRAEKSVDIMCEATVSGDIVGDVGFYCDNSNADNMWVSGSFGDAMDNGALSYDHVKEDETETDEVVMHPDRFLMGPFQLHDPRSTRTIEPDSIAQTPGDGNEQDVPTYIANKRPRRAAAILAEQRVLEVLKWEKCKESSSMFKNAAVQINEEFDRASRGTRKKTPAVVSQSPVAGASLPLVPESQVPIQVTDIDSDDEGAADVDCPDVEMNNDKEDDMDNDEDDSGSLASFVVSDSYISEAGGVSDTESVQDDSGSGSEYDNESESVCDSDSDGNFSCTETDSEGETGQQSRWSDKA